MKYNLLMEYINKKIYYFLNNILLNKQDLNNIVEKHYDIIYMNYNLKEEVKKKISEKIVI